MKTTFFLLFILLTSVGFIMSKKYEDYPVSRGEQLVNSTLSKSAKIIQDKYDIKPCGEGASMPGGPIRKLTLCFDTKYPHTKEQLRELVVKSAQELLKQVNENEEIQEYLYEKPFTMKNIHIIIYNHNKDRREVYDPGIATAQIAQGVLTFRTVDKSDTFRFKDQFEESYEEALKLLNQ